MDRRDFLALIGSAPLATLEALAPLPYCLPTQTLPATIVSHTTEGLLITSGAVGYMWSAAELAERRLLGKPMLDVNVDPRAPSAFQTMWERG